MKRRTKPGFERIAPIYPWLEFLVYGNLQTKGREAFLSALTHCQNILLLGEGNGRFLRTLLTQNPHCRATVIEISPRMIQLAQQRLSAEQKRRVHWIQQSVLQAPPPPDVYDAIITHYLFDLFPPREQKLIVQTYTQSLSPGGLWQDTELISGGPGTYYRMRNQMIHRILYRTLGSLCDFPARCLHNPLPLFERAGLRLQKEQTFSHHFSARLWQKDTPDSHEVPSKEASPEHGTDESLQGIP
jgi:SAM-dependent methyltransferase